MNEQIIRFLKRVDEDPAVRREVEAVAGGSECAGDVTDIARAHGYEFAPEELLAVLELLKTAPETTDRDRPLDDAQLEEVAGGFDNSVLLRRMITG